MRSILFYIPAELWGHPVFGVGWLLAAWIVIGLLLLVWIASQPGGRRDVLSFVPYLVVVAAVIVFVLPLLVTYDVGAGHKPLGIPIRGFGVMLMLATISAVGLAAHRAWQVGVDPEAIYSLAFVMFIAGIIGARAFFVVQYWPEFAVDGDGKQLALPALLGKVLNATQGGLVVYGSVLAGLPAGIWYCRRRGLPILMIADIIAPSMVVGQALGRIGCFLNGCCYGGVCLAGSLAVTFPAESDPYRAQLKSGWQSGIWLEERDGKVVVAYVAPDSPPETAGLKAGDELDAINRVPVTSVAQARAALAAGGELTNVKFRYEVQTKRGDIFRWEIPPQPARTVPMHPAQLYAAFDAGLLALVLWLLYPFRRKDGEIFAFLVTLHPLSRFLLEIIRSDEGGFAGTPLTISQWLSLGILVGAGVLWWYIERQPSRAKAAA